SVTEDEAGGDADEGERLGEGDTDPHQDLQAACELWLASDRLDRLADDEAHADGRADGGEAIADRGDRALDLGENHRSVHWIFPFVGRRHAWGAPSVLFRDRELNVDR